MEPISFLCDELAPPLLPVDEDDDVFDLSPSLQSGRCVSKMLCPEVITSSTTRHRLALCEKSLRSFSPSHILFSLFAADHRDVVLDRDGGRKGERRVGDSADEIEGQSPDRFVERFGDGDEEFGTRNSQPQIDVNRRNRFRFLE